MPEPLTDASRQSLGAHVACHECALVQHVPRTDRGEAVVCARCGVVLHRQLGQRSHWLLPLTIAAAILFVIANATPILALDANGTQTTASLAGAVMALVADGMSLMAVLLMLTTLVVPSFDLAVLVSAAVALRRSSASHSLNVALRLMYHLRRWAMVEVFMLGALVSVVKLSAVARVVPGMGIWSLAGYVVLSAAAHASLDGSDYWTRTGTRG